MFKTKKKPNLAGQIYTGPATWCDDYTAVPRPSYYALSDDGKKLLVDMPLVCIDDAPGDPEDGACHYVYAGENEYPQRRANGERIPIGHPVDLEMQAEGKAEWGA